MKNHVPPVSPSRWTELESALDAGLDGCVLSRGAAADEARNGLQVLDDRQREEVAGWVEIIAAYGAGALSQEEFCRGRTYVRTDRHGVRRELPLGLDRLKRALRAQREGGDGALCDGRHLNPGRPVELQDGPFLYLLHLKDRHPDWDWGRCRDGLGEFLAGPGGRFGWRLPSLRQIRSGLGRLPEDLRAFLLEGGRGWWRGHFGLTPTGPRFAVNELWVADAGRLTRLRFKDARTGKVFSPSVVFLMDAASRVLMGCLLFAGPPSRHAMLAALRRAMLPKGTDHYPAPCRPEGVLTDRGPEFKNGDTILACRQLGVGKIFTDPHMPMQNGTAEAFVKKVKRRMVAAVQLALARQFGVRAHVPSGRWSFVAEEFERAVQAYQLRPQKALGGLCPLRYYETHLREADFRPVEAASVVAATMARHSVKVAQDGVRLPGKPGTFAGPCLAELVGRRVTLLLHPLADNRRVEVLHGGVSAGFVESCGPGTGARLAAACKSGRDRHVKVLMAARQIVREVGAAGVPAPAKASAKAPTPTPRKSPPSASAPKPAAFQWGQEDDAPLGPLHAPDAPSPSDEF